jgi:hypothetical protein
MHVRSSARAGDALTPFIGRKACRRFPSPAFREMAKIAASSVGDWIDCERVRWRKSAVFVQRDGAAGEVAALQPRRDFL